MNYLSSGMFRTLCSFSLGLRFGVGFFLLSSFSLIAERVEDISNPRVRDGSWVTDQPGALSENTISELNTLLDHLEERLQSVDYDVWACSGCDHHFTLRYPRWFASHGSCPQCSNRTCRKTETVIRAATTSSSGSVRVTEDCEFCTYHRQYHRTIARKTGSSSSSGGSSSFGGGSSSGGGVSRGY